MQEQALRWQMKNRVLVDDLVKAQDDKVTSLDTGREIWNITIYYTNDNCAQKNPASVAGRLKKFTKVTT